MLTHTHTPRSTLPAVKFWMTTRRSLTHVCRAALRTRFSSVKALVSSTNLSFSSSSSWWDTMPSAKSATSALQQGQWLRNLSSALLACLLGGLLLPHPALHEPSFSTNPDQTPDALCQQLSIIKLSTPITKCSAGAREAKITKGNHCHSI